MYYVCTQSIVTNLRDVTKSHITHHMSHTTQSIQMQGEEEPRRVNQSAFQISTLPVYLGKMLKCLQIFLSYFNSANIFQSTDNFCRCTTTKHHHYHDKQI